MRRDVSLDRAEAQTLEDVLEYIVSQDEKELRDFEQQVIDNHGAIVLEGLFDEYGNLLTKVVPKELQSHVFFKASILLNELRKRVYGD